MERFLIKGGYIVDGSGRKGYTGDLLTEGGLIGAMAPFISMDEDCRVIDAADFVICPGFIDTHSHSDVQLLIDPHIEAKIRQGITTEILGQDGISVAPLPALYARDWRKNLAGLDGDSDQIDWHFPTSADYLNRLEQKGLALNAAYLAPHGNIRMEAIGLGNKRVSAYELDRMKDILAREFTCGVVGLSTGLIYPPCHFAGLEELTALCRVTAEHDGVFVVHQRSEADNILASMEEVLELGRRTGVKIHFSHFKVCGRKNWDKTGEILEKLDQAREDGLRVSFDQYPYVSGSTMLAVILPPWVFEGGTDRMLERIGDQRLRDRIRTDIGTGIAGWDNFVDFAGYDRIYVTSVKTKNNGWCIGKSLMELAEKRGTDPLDAALDLLIEEENSVGMIDFYGLEEHVSLFMKRQEQNVCTDGLLGGKPHPRVYGAFPRVLGKYVREERVLSMEEAIQKMTGKPADVFGLRERGILREGAAADILLINPKTVRDKGTYTEPEQYAEGIEGVIVNGKLILEKGNYHGQSSGKVLRSCR